MTTDLPIRDPEQIRRDCAMKLRDVQVSDHFQAILGCPLGEDWTKPRLVVMVISRTDTCSVGATARRRSRTSRVRSRSWTPGYRVDTGRGRAQNPRRSERHRRQY